MTSSYRNLYVETINAIHDSGHDPADIWYVGTHTIALDLNNFFEVAKNTNYDAGYGSAEIPIDLMVIFQDKSYLARQEYDGSEWWKFFPCPHYPTKTNQKITKDSFVDPKFRYCDYLSDYIK